jgi:hypothetical protein
MLLEAPDIHIKELPVQPSSNVTQPIIDESGVGIVIDPRHFRLANGRLDFALGAYASFLFWIPITDANNVVKLLGGESIMPCSVVFFTNKSRRWE